MRTTLTNTTLWFHFGIWSFWQKHPLIGTKMANKEAVYGYTMANKEAVSTNKLKCRAYDLQIAILEWDQKVALANENEDQKYLYKHEKNMAEIELEDVRFLLTGIEDLQAKLKLNQDLRMKSTQYLQAEKELFTQRAKLAEKI